MAVSHIARVVMSGCAIVLALTACEPKRIEAIKPPADLTQCADEPDAPALDAVPWDTPEARTVQMQRDALTLAYILAMRSAWGDCASKVSGVKAWSDGL